MIPLCSPLAQYRHHQTDIQAALARVLDKGHYILGDEVTKFEAAFASYLKTPDAVGVGNGTDAIVLALLACGIGPGDEVITVSHTAVATVSAIRSVGATPVLVDIEPKYFGMDPEALNKALTPKTKAVIPVHIYGQPVDLESVRSFTEAKGLFLIEDCAQAHGSYYQGQRTGSFGHLSTFSFYPTKNLGAIGDGGLVSGRDKDLVGKVRLLRQYGWERRYISDSHGINSRLDELQAAILNVKLKHLDADNAQRRYHATVYSESLRGSSLFEVPEVRPHTEPVFHLYVVKAKNRPELTKRLESQGVGYGIHYPVPVHLQAGYASVSRTVGELPVTTALAEKILSLPMYPELSEADRNSVIKACHG